VAKYHVLMLPISEDINPFEAKKMALIITIFVYI